MGMKQLVINTYILMLSVSLFSSCQKDRVGMVLEKESFDAFPVSDTLYFKELMAFTDDEPETIIQHDSLLVVQTRGTSREFWFYIFSVNSGLLLKKVLPYGRGLNEALGVFGSGIVGDSLWAYDITKKTIYKANIPDLLYRDSLVFRAYNIEKPYYQVSFLDDSTIVGTGDFEIEQKLSFVNIYTGKRMYSKGDYQAQDSNVPLSVFKDAMTCYTTVRPDGKYICAPYRYTDVLEIFTRDGEEMFRIQGPEKFEAIYDIGQRGDSYFMRKNSGTRKAFIDVDSDNDYIYACFSGHGRKSELWPYATRLFVYDWGGNPVRSYFLVEPLGLISISATDKAVYSYSSEKGRIIYAKIPSNS